MWRVQSRDWLDQTLQGLAERPGRVERAEWLAARLSALGFDRSVFVALPRRAPPLVTSTMPQWWETHYQERRFDRVDPLLKVACRSYRPTWAGRAFLKERAHELTVEQRQFVLEGGEAGLTAGMTVPLGLAHEDLTAGWVVGSDVSPKELESLWRIHGDAIAIALAIGYGGGSRGAPKTQDAPILTARERACLQGLASGEQLKQIGHRLGIGYATVEFHLRNARRKLGASTREQALAIALSQGILDLEL